MWRIPEDLDLLSFSIFFQKENILQVFAMEIFIKYLKILYFFFPLELLFSKLYQWRFDEDCEILNQTSQRKVQIRQNKNSLNFK